MSLSFVLRSIANKILVRKAANDRAWNGLNMITKYSNAKRVVRIFLVFGLIMQAPLSTHAEAVDRPTVGSYVKAYSGTDGVMVWATRYGERERGAALIQITGIDHPMDKRIILTDVEKTERDVRYIMDNGGKKFVLVIISDYGSELYLPGATQPIRLNYDQSASRMGNAEHFLTDYLEQTE
ncbi:hypothetical protein [Brucella pituitosa]|uniref:hypothetical protein n=1 Tax=Brucella pituitosa TaxID=571256 RepID=UPI0009A162A3|nr:hypothetical protein [Brucella pituitosa]